MNNALRLVKIYLLNNTGVNRLIHQRGKGGRLKAAGLLLGFALLGLMLLGVSFFYSYMLSQAFAMMEMLRILPALMMAVSSLMVLVTTIYKAGSILFSFRDYDLMMALPVSQGSVVASRILILYLMNLLFTLVVMVPMLAAYTLTAHPGVMFYLMFFLTLLFIPMLPVVLASVIGVLVSIISARFKHKSLIGTLLMLAATLAVVFGSFSLGDNADRLGEIGAVMMAAVNKIYPMAGMYSNALCDENLTSLSLFLLCSALPFVLFIVIVARGFQTMHTRLISVGTRSNYVLTRGKTNTPLMALYQKELRRFLASPLYILNTSIGMVLSLVISIAVFFVPAEQLEQMIGLPGFSSMISVIMPVFLCFFIGLSCTSACSVSLEGKSLWIVRSLPVNTKTVFTAKVRVNLTVSVPITLIDGILLAVFLKPGLADGVLLFAIPLLFCVYTSLMGLFFNLVFPNFTWTTEMAVIKQSAATFCGIFAGMLPPVGAIALVFALPNATPWILPLFGGIVLLAIFAFWAALSRYGTARFESF